MLLTVQLDAEISAAKRELKKAQTIMQMDELKSRKRVLRRLGIAPGIVSHAYSILLL